MPYPLKKATLRAEKLLSTPHPKHPERMYTMAEAAEKAGINRSTIYRHMWKKEGRKNG